MTGDGPARGTGSPRGGRPGAGEPPAPAPAVAALAVIVAGVAGSGKTTVGTVLARQAGAVFADGDRFHTPASIARIRAGHPLADADRWPWLETIAAWLDARAAAGEPAVIACSALRRSYRAFLMDGRPWTRLVYLDVDRPRLERRLTERAGHFFPARLLDSQLATAEPPLPGPRSLIIIPGDRPGDTAEAIASWLGASGATAGRW